MSKHPPKALRAASIAVILGLILASTAFASPQIYQSLEDLARRSDGCALARVVDERVHWNEARTLIVTTFTLEVEESLAGGVSTGPVLLHRLGGELDGMALGYEGMPVLRVGDRSVVFVHERAPSTYIVSGMEQGVLHESGGIFVRDLRGVLLAPAASESLDLDELRKRVHIPTERRP